MMMGCGRVLVLVYSVSFVWGKFPFENIQLEK